MLRQKILHFPLQKPEEDEIIKIHLAESELVLKIDSS